MKIEDVIVTAILVILLVVWLAGCVTIVPKPDDSWLGEAYNQTVRNNEGKH